nr:alpha-ketoglutarate-dependent dioxygenase AlkB [Sphingomonas formosensis]
MTTPGGYMMSVATTNCGTAGWVTDRTGYRYDRIDPQTGSPWPAMPDCFLQLAGAAADVAGATGAGERSLHESREPPLPRGRKAVGNRRVTPCDPRSPLETADDLARAVITLSNGARVRLGEIATITEATAYRSENQPYRCRPSRRNSGSIQITKMDHVGR